MILLVFFAAFTADIKASPTESTENICYDISEVNTISFVSVAKKVNLQVDHTMVRSLQLTTNNNLVDHTLDLSKQVDVGKSVTSKDSRLRSLHQLAQNLKLTLFNLRKSTGQDDARDPLPDISTSEIS